MGKYSSPDHTCEPIFFLFFEFQKGWVRTKPSASCRRAVHVARSHPRGPQNRGRTNMSQELDILIVCSTSKFYVACMTLDMH
jgi:hypothetical protein